MVKMNPKDIMALSRAPLHLLPSVTVIHGAMAIRQGAIEYGPYNWREKPISLMMYIGAIKRHSERLQDGQWTDKKSGQSHLGHIIATSGILLDAYHCGTLIDDRPKRSGAATKLLDEIEELLKDATVEQNRTFKNKTRGATSRRGHRPGPHARAAK